MLIATFGPTTGWVGKTITFEDEQFVLHGHGSISAQAVLDYDRQGQIVWAYGGLREWVSGIAAGASTPPAAATASPAYGTRRAGLSTAAKAAIAVGVVVVLVIVVIGAAMQSGGSSAPPEVAYTLTADELSQAYSANEVAADSKYMGKWVEVTGTAGDIGTELMGHPYVVLDSTDVMTPSIQCVCASDQENAVAGLTRGSSVTLVGKVEGMLGYVEMSDCELK